MAYKEYTVEQIEAYAEELISSAQKLVEVAKKMRDERIKTLWVPWAKKHLEAFVYASTMGKEADNALDEFFLDLSTLGESRRKSQAKNSAYQRELRARKNPEKPSIETRGRPRKTD